MGGNVEAYYESLADEALHRKKFQQEQALKAVAELMAYHGMPQRFRDSLEDLRNWLKVNGVY